MARITFLSSFIKRWTVWEYLPSWAANIPVYGFWLLFSLRARHPFFFSNVNPDIPLGGALGESKSDILRLLPPEIVPEWVLVSPATPFEEVQAALEKAHIGFPLMAKPDIGERGFLVKKIETPAELRAYLEQWPVPFILQKFLAQPREASVLFYRFPGSEGRFGISSICLKEFMRVRGDGVSTIRALMARRTRSAFQLARFEQDFPEVLNYIPSEGEERLLEPVGNHARGTKFLNGDHLLDAQLVASFTSICTHLTGVLFGRFDLKYEDETALRLGKFQTMELNGVFAEPAHIYDPSHGMWRAYQDLWRHWRLLFLLHRAQKKMGIQPTSLGESWRFIRGYLGYKKMLRAIKR
jgi:hypothetical protein